jgi:hypothetical protein
VNVCVLDPSRQDLGWGLTACGCEDYEAGPVVFDQLAHAAAARRSKVDHHRGCSLGGGMCVGAWLSYECRCDSRIAFVL